MLINLDEEIEAQVRDIMRRYPRLVDTKRGRSVGDPFVIAVAQARKLTVITVCADLGIRWVRIIDFFREQKWVL